MISLDDKIALVTGGSRGIGAAAALMLADAGATVIVNYNNNQKSARTVVNRINKKHGDGRGLSIKANVSDSAEVEKMFKKIRKDFGRLDILINNAGIWEMAPILSMTDEMLLKTIRINYLGAVYCAREGARIMKDNSSGVIVNISSTAARRGEAFYSHYSSTKAALLGLTKSLAVELGSYNIRVNAVAPGWVNTDMSAEAIEEKGDTIKDRIPLGRIAEAEDIAGPIVFLCSDLASFMTGAIIDVNGGGVLVD